MEEKYFISSSFEETIDNYQRLAKSNTLGSTDDFNIMVLKMLILIYGELDFINPRITKDDKAVYRNMMKYGYSIADIKEFFAEFNKYNLLTINNDEEKNKYAMSIQTKMIDMLFLKRKVIGLNDSDLNVFYAFLSSLNSIDAIDYFKQKLYHVTEESKEVEYLEVEPNFIAKEEKGKQNKLTFELSSTSGFASIIVILSVIAVVCIVVIIVNLVVG